MASLNFDTSSYPSAQVAPQDPLAMIGKVLQIQGAQQGLAMQQQEFKARQAMGPIFQSAIDPQTGELDSNKLMIGLAHPDTAYKAPEIMMQLIQRQNTQADTVLKNAAANKIKYEAAVGAAGSLLAEAETSAVGRVDLASGGQGKPATTSKQLASTLSGLVGESGLLDAKDAAEMLTKTAGMTDNQRYQYIKNFAVAGQGIVKTMEGIYGAITNVPTGGGHMPLQNRPLIGQTRQAGPMVENTPTPAEMNAPVAGVDAQGRPTIRPRVQAAPMYGGSGAPIAGSGGASAPTGLSPQETKLQETRATAANDYDTSLNEANTVGQENIRILREMQEALKGFKAGGGMEVRERIAGLADALGFPKSVVDAAAGGDRGAIQEFQKLAVRYATSEMKSNMGSGQRFTNLDFSTFLKNNPTIATDPRGLDKMFNFLKQGVWLAGQQQEQHNDWKRGWRPKGFENAGMDSFPAWWTKVLEARNAPEPKAK